MRHFEDADALLELLRSGRLPQLAQSMECKIGIDLAAYHDPKTAVRDFLERYSNGQVKVTYQHKRSAAGIVAKLVTPQFCERVFEGSVAADEKGAEVSACKAFLKDPQVLKTGAAIHLVDPQTLTVQQVSEEFDQRARLVSQRASN